MAAVEANGKTVEEAIESALEELGAERGQVEVEVLEEPKGGILGVGGHQARVRVWLIGDEDVDEDDDEDAEDEDAQPRADDDEDDEEPVEDEAEFAAQMLDQLLVHMGIEADVSIRDAETPGDGLGMAKAVLEVEGDDLGVLIGRRGETLGALQYLLNLMVSRQAGEGNYFTVDIEGYRRRRERQLRTLAQRTAEQVKRTKRPVTLEPMPPNERRIIHLTLSEDRYVSTDSVGEGEDRKVSISPKR
ncbi:MAG: protein jag [Chloroflexi bacterium]|nr:protein jag [Chloroflexota bacterium]